MNLTEAVNLIAAQLHCDAKELLAYTAEDNIGGYHWNGALATFPAGSIWAVEGVILYALTRYLKPAKVVEIGSWGGCSAAHLALAVKANGVGHVYSVDNGSETTFEPGNLLPTELKPYVTLVRANGEDFLAEQEDGSIGLMFEDANHTSGLVALLVSLGLKKCAPGSVIVNHDAGRQFAYDGNGRQVDHANASALGRRVRDGLAEAPAYFRPYLVEPSDCGFAITVVPGQRRTTKWAGGNDGFGSNVITQSPVAQDHIAALSQVGNANIESDGLIKPVVPMSQRLSTRLDSDFLNDDGNQHMEAQKPVKKTRTRKAK